MFRAKTGGHGRHVFFNQTIRGELEERLSLTAELERASDHGEFELFYQPQFRLKDRQLVGAEALIRWHHPVRGLVPPGAFLAVLETTSVADRTARWVIKSACRQGHLWQQMGHGIRIGANLSPTQFASGDLAASVEAILAETGFSPSLLELEVTENILLADDERAREIFRRIRDLGARIALDDFGTGYSNLRALMHLPIQTVKLDRSLICDVAKDARVAKLVGSMLHAAHALDVRIVAEGVEEEAQAILLRAAGVDRMQGFWFARPMPAEQLETTLIASHAQAPQLSAAALPR